MSWDLWVDYHRIDEHGLTHTNQRNANVELRIGDFVVVGNEEADPAVAEVMAVEPDGTVLVRVLPGPVDQHLHLVAGRQSG
jgi:imidazolonepropionase-like amidohydrolase